MSQLSPEYLIIKGYYAERRAECSNVFLMAHIEEGLAILDVINASDVAKRAFCLHPITQNEVDIDLQWSSAFDLACEYRDVANFYLCRPENDWIKTVEDVDTHFSKIPPMSKDCRDMLLADKIQNRKDFRLYHYGTHDRSEQLELYFDLWVQYLWSLK